MSEKTRHRVTFGGLGTSSSIANETPSHEKLRLYEFGPFLLDPAERILRRGSETVPLTPKAFDTLHLLVRNSGHLLEKDELIRELWPDTFVEEGSLSNNIFLLRRALGDDQLFIETIPRRGYRFVGAVLQLPYVAPAHLEELSPGHPELVNKGSRGFRLSPPVAATIGMLILAVLGAALWWHHSPRLPERSEWVQLTRFPDSVTQPSLSPDGRMVTFIRGSSTFVGPGQIYVKILPDGEPAQLTHDSLGKMSPTFSPDGTRIAYTTVDPAFHWDTWTVPVLGGEPQLLLKNASGLVWTGPHRVLFSEIKMGEHMAIVVAEESRVGQRDVYVPVDESGMAHRSYASPDQKWALVVEMDQDNLWLPCRAVPLDGKSPGRTVGPSSGGCTSGAWSSDGKWIYLTSDHGGAPHIWRQRFPDGIPEQVTSGPTEEEGIAMAPDGRSFVTAAALQNASLWLHDESGDRRVSLEGNVTDPAFTLDGGKLLYRNVNEAPNQFGFYRFYRDSGELRILDLKSGRSQPLFRGLPVLNYDLSSNGREIVMEIADARGKPRVWLATLDRSTPPREISNVEGTTPKFGPDGEILFRHVEGEHSPQGSNGFVYRVHPDGTGMRRALGQPVDPLWKVSRDGRWVVSWGTLNGKGPVAQRAFPLDGGPPILIGAGWLSMLWSTDGRSISITSRSAGPIADGWTYIVPLPVGQMFPQIPAAGFRSEEEISRLPGARKVEAIGAAPGLSPEDYAFYRGTAQRNLYRIPIP